jgi:hypothetical protein
MRSIPVSFSATEIDQASGAYLIYRNSFKVTISADYICLEVLLLNRSKYGHVTVDF